MTTISKNVSSSKSSTKSNGTAAPSKPANGASTAPAKSKTTAQQPPKRDEKLPIHRRVGRQLLIAAKRWGTFGRVTKGWSAEIDVTMAEVAEAIVNAARAVEKLPADFAPPRRKGGGGGNASPLTVGSFVDITEKALKVYAGVIDDSDMKQLEVIKVTPKLVFKTQSGERVLIKRGHVKPVAKAAPQSAPAVEA